MSSLSLGKRSIAAITMPLSAAASANPQKLARGTIIFWLTYQKKLRLLA
jgi:hypothetical protein